MSRPENKKPKQAINIVQQEKERLKTSLINSIHNQIQLWNYENKKVDYIILNTYYILLKDSNDENNNSGNTDKQIKIVGQKYEEFDNIIKNLSKEKDL